MKIKQFIISYVIAALIGFALLPTTVKAASYTTTITNFDSQGQQVTKYDINGNSVDAHDGDLAYF